MMALQMLGWLIDVYATLLFTVGTSIRVQGEVHEGREWQTHGAYGFMLGAVLIAAARLLEAIV